MKAFEVEAKQLFEKFRDIESLRELGGMDSDLAKECALICINEIIEYYFPGWTITYLENIKKEIEKL